MGELTKVDFEKPGGYDATFAYARIPTGTFPLKKRRRFFRKTKLELCRIKGAFDRRRFSFEKDKE